MSRRRPLIIALSTALAISACGPPPAFPPPPQKVMPIGSDPRDAVILLRVGEPGYRERVLGGMLYSKSGDQWCWTGESPRFKLLIDPGIWDLYAEFTVPKVILDKVGPVTVRFIVNGRVIGSQTYSKDGNYEVSVRVPPDLLRDDEFVKFGLDIDPIYVAEADRVKLGVLLSAIGFHQADRR